MQTRTCCQCAASFEITPEDLTFYDKISPTFDGTKFPILPPTLCPDCRLQSRLVWRNERSLYRRTCSATGESIISCIAPNKPHKVFKKEAWWSDQRDARDFGSDFDFETPFFSQLDRLVKSAPWMNLFLDNAVNSEYVNFCNNVKDCCLLFASNNNENCMYSNGLWGCRDCLECTQGFDNELCYESVELNKCYRTHYSKGCSHVSDSYFCENCRNCQNCFGCVNLVGKSYHFFNEPLTKEQYEKKLAAFRIDTLSGVSDLARQFEQYRLQFPVRAALITNCENTTGNHLKNCKNTFESFDTSGAYDCKWVALGSDPIRDCYDSTGVEETELCYQTVGVGVPASRTLFSVLAWKGVHNLYYSILSPGSKDCFGVVGMHKGQYCILNKQYSREDYDKMCARIIEHMQKNGEWGEFFPANLSPFDYNETVAQDHFPMSEEEISKRGWRWRKREEREFVKTGVVISDAINDVSAEITKEICTCKECGKNYRITAQELAFYKTHRIPVPVLCPDCRHIARQQRRTPWRLWTRTCAKCHAGIQTALSPDRPETVYCEKCYLEMVY